MIEISIKNVKKGEIYCSKERDRSFIWECNQNGAALYSCYYYYRTDHNNTIIQEKVKTNSSIHGWYSGNKIANEEEKEAFFKHFPEKRPLYSFNKLQILLDEIYK